MNLRNLIGGICAVLLFSTQFSANAQCSGFNVTASIYKSDTVCVDDSLYLIATPSNSNAAIDWILPDNSMITNAQVIGTAMAQTGNTGLYKAVARLGSCRDTTDIYVRVRTRPALPTASDNTPICEGDTLKITINNPMPHQVAYELTDANLQVISRTQTTNLVNTQANNFYQFGVIIVDTNGCGNGQWHSVSDIYTKPPKPTAAASKNSICIGDTLSLAGSSIPWQYDYNWYINGQTYNSPIVYLTPFTQAGTFNFPLVINNRGCLSEADTAKVTVNAPLSPTLNATVNKTEVGPYAPVTFTAVPANEGANATYQWVKNGSNIPGATNQTLTLNALTDLSTTDKVYVVMNTNNDCATPKVLTSQPVSININLGVKDITQQEGLSVYPNPVKDVLNVSGIPADEQVSVINITGARVNLTGKTTRTSDGMTINTSELPSGIYVLRAGKSSVRFTKTK